MKEIIKEDVNQLKDGNFSKNATRIKRPIPRRNDTRSETLKNSTNSTLETEPEEPIVEEQVVEPEVVVYEEPKTKLKRKKAPIISKFAGVQIKKERKVYKPPEPIKKVVYEKVEEIF